ncbi:MAG: bifunctional demethylmenaquinone methyltransferase/2-methoxy-6-polyprenyl-1,4-benzoquinol methylase UbiE [Bacteroidales bacterium]|nr:bifunctional demethylmenaquinone methyltransferase/2-methoxy-6-polyprenyl-1,4-benzoquinol methylase UbiE [Bacteroidales bacterium]
MPKKEKIRSMFDSIAGDYDALNHLMSLDADKGWRRKAMKKVLEGTAPSQNIRILDLACGTGDFSIAIAKEMVSRAKKEGGPLSGHVDGVDLSEGMLKVMEKKLEEEGLADLISISQGDGEDLPYADCTFDRVTIAFGIRNFQDREKGLKEMLRVLAPGGKLVILELSLPDNALVRWAFNLYFLHLLPLIGGKISGDKSAYRYLPASVVGFPKKKEFMETMSSCGFHNVAHKAFTFGICRMYTGEKSR